jgi:large subunit ribosomal protein L17
MDSSQRLATLRNMAASLIKYGRIHTTLPRAKELRRLADQLVTLGKKNTLHAKRQAFNFLRQRDVVQRLFAEVAPAFTGRNGGYTRIYRLGVRAGDAAKTAVIEYLSEVIAPLITKKDQPKKEKKAAAAKEDKKETKKVDKKAKEKAEKKVEKKK